MIIISAKCISQFWNACVLLLQNQGKDEVHNNKAVQGRDLKDKNNSKMLRILNIP